MSYFGNRDTRGRNQQDGNQPRRRSALGLFFNPNLGASFRTLKESLYIFVRLIALVFAQADLIDRRHPAVTGADNQKYSLWDVLNLAYQRVEWRQENLPQTGLFVGVCVCIGLCALALVYAVFGILFGLAGPSR